MRKGNGNFSLIKRNPAFNLKTVPGTIIAKQTPPRIQAAEMTKSSERSGAFPLKGTIIPELPHPLKNYTILPFTQRS